MRIVVTGGFGFLGAHVTRTLCRAGHDAVPLSRRNGLDLRDGESTGALLSKLRPDLVVHCAARVGGIAYNDLKPVEVFTDNTRIAMGLLEGLETAGVDRLVSILPNCTYPGDKAIYTETGWWDGPLHPSVMCYGLPRKVLWGLAESHARKWGLRSVHLILPNMYGPGDHFDPVRSHALGALVSKIVDAQRSGVGEVLVWGTGKPVREWLYVEDGAEVVALVMDRFDAAVEVPDRILNIGTGQGVSIGELARMIQAAAGWDGTLLFDPTRPDGAPVKRMDPQRMRQVLGWSPPTGLSAGIAATVAWYR